MTKYLLLTKYGSTDEMPSMDEWSPEDINAHIDFLQAINKNLIERGELVDGQALAGRESAKIVKANADGAPFITDGPFPEFKEMLAGYQMIDVASEARALEIAELVSSAPGPGGTPLGQSIEVRQVMGALPGVDV